MPYLKQIKVAASEVNLKLTKVFASELIGIGSNFTLLEHLSAHYHLSSAFRFSWSLAKHKHKLFEIVRITYYHLLSKSFSNVAIIDLRAPALAILASVWKVSSATIVTSDVTEIAMASDFFETDPTGASVKWVSSLGPQYDEIVGLVL